MRFKLTILLAILNLAIFCLILYVDRNQGSKDEFLTQSRIILDPSFVQGVDNIQISSPRTGNAWELQRMDDASWNVTQPVHWKANPFAVQQLLFQLKALSWLHKFPTDSLETAGQSLQSYDLLDPPLQVSLSSGSESISLSFGAPTEIGNRLYMMSPNGDYIMVISRELANTLHQSLSEFLDRRIFGPGMEESRVVQIQDRTASNVRVRMERTDRNWYFVSPIEAAADNDRVQALLGDWQNQEGQGFRMPTAEEGEVEGEGLRLTLEGLNSRETLVFNTTTGEDGEGSYYLARMEGFETVFQVSAGKVDALRRVLEDLREKRVLSRHADNWTSMEILFDDISTTLQRLENGAWQVLNKNAAGELNSQPADPVVVQEIRHLLNTLEVTRFVSDAPSETDLSRYGLITPQRRIILRKEDGKSVEMSIGGLSREGNETLLYGTTDEIASVFLIRPHILSSIPMNPMHYRERTIRTIPESTQIVSIWLDETATGKTREIKEETTPLAWANLRSYLRDIEVEGFINPPFSNPLRLDNNRTIEWPFQINCEIRYPESINGETTIQTLYLTERIGGTTQYVGDSETGLVGILPIDLIEVLEPLLVKFPDDPGMPEKQNEAEDVPGTES